MAAASWPRHNIVSWEDIDEARRVVAGVGFAFDPSVDFLGQGSYALVFKAQKTAKPMEVAVKVCSEKLIADDAAKKRLHSEVALHAKLSHPNIVRLFHHNFDPQSGVIVLVMEKCTCSLLDVVGKGIYCGRGTPLPEETVRVYARQIASALDYLGGFNVAHRDMSLANVLCVETGDKDVPYIMKLADFGFAKEQPEDLMSTAAVGTPLFRAPEIIMKKPYTIASDIWSFGTLVFAMLTGRNVVGAVQTMEGLTAWINVNESVGLPADCACSSDCRDFVLRCLQRNPEKRITHNQLLGHPWLGSLQTLCHPNVLKFSLSDSVNFPETPNGSATEKIPSAKPEELTAIALSCANGMAHLVSRGVVHRALRASNLFFVRQPDGSTSYKVGGFDLLQLIHNGSCVADPSQCPVKWTAPEALRDGVFTEKSDVWSFGVMLWELFSRSAEEPFGISELNRDQMLAKLDAGDRLVLPSGCDPKIAALMERCFAANTADRPTFEQISEQLREVSASFIPQKHFPDQPSYVHAKLQPLHSGGRVHLEANSSSHIASEVLANADAWWQSVFGAVPEVPWAIFAEKFGPAAAAAVDPARLLLLKPARHGAVVEPVVPLAHWKFFMLNFHKHLLAFGQTPSSVIDLQLAAQIATHPLFRGFIGGGEANTLLQGHPKGSCFLRLTTSPTASSKGWLTLSFVASNLQVVHLVIGRHAPDEFTISFCNRQHDFTVPREISNQQFCYDANAPASSQSFDIPVYTAPAQGDTHSCLLSELLRAVEEKHRFKLRCTL